MARHKEFDVNEALDRAVQLFWRRGYEGTSLQELQEHMGIGRQSLYDTFGDKHSLFLAALDRYMEQGRARVHRSLQEPKASWGAVRQYFDELLAFLTPRGERSACLVTNTIAEFGREDPEISRRCQGNERALAAALEQALRRAIDKGELNRSVDPKQATIFLVSQVYGLGVLARNGASRAQLRSVIHHALSSIQTPEP
jgi:TetR/AcrR family transcriptional repressor of nem operon